MTTQIKIQCYKAVRNRIANNINGNKKGICTLLRMYCINKKIEVSEILINDFPELVDFSPKEDWVGGCWFEFTELGNKKRIQILDIVIKHLER